MAKNVIYHVRQTPEQIAYLAGIIDGEGCFYIGTTKQKYGTGFQWHAMLKITNCDVVLIEWLEQVFGGYRESRSRWTSKKAFERPVYSWQATGDMLDYIIESVMPYLIIKRRHCNVMKRYRMTKLPGSTRLTDSVNDQRLELMKELRNLNSRFHNHPLKESSALLPVS